MKYIEHFKCQMKTKITIDFNARESIIFHSILPTKTVVIVLLRIYSCCLTTYLIDYHCRNIFIRLYITFSTRVLAQGHQEWTGQANVFYPLLSGVKIFSVVLCPTENRLQNASRKILKLTVANKYNFCLVYFDRSGSVS